MGQESRIAHVFCVFLEHIDKELADDLALGLGVRDTVELAQEQLLLVSVDQRHVVVVAEHGDDLFGLTLAQQTVVNEDAGQLIANGFVNQHGGDGGVHAAGKATDHLLVAHLLADRGNGFLTVGAHGPVAFEPCQTHEVLIEAWAVGGVVHLGVELHGVEVARHVAGDGERRVGEVP